MFDNLFGLAGTLGTSAVLFLMLATVGIAVSFVSRASLTTGRYSRRI